MEAKHDDLAEALIRRRKEFAQKATGPAHSLMVKEPVAEEAAEAELLNRGQGEIAPAGATPEGMVANPMDVPQGDAMKLTPEMFLKEMGSKNAPGLRGRAMAHAEAMKKK